MIMADVKELVRTKISGKKVMVFSKTYCPYCKKAKEVLRRHLGKEISNKDMEIWELDNEEKGHQIQQELKRLTGATSVRLTLSLSLSLSLC